VRWFGLDQVAERDTVDERGPEVVITPEIT